MYRRFQNERTVRAEFAHHADCGRKRSPADSHLNRKNKHDIQQNIYHTAEHHTKHGAVRIFVCPDKNRNIIGKYRYRKKDIDIAHISQRVWIKGIICAHQTKQRGNAKPIDNPQYTRNNCQCKKPVRFAKIAGSAVNAHLHRAANTEQNPHCHQNTQKRCGDAQCRKCV